MRSVCHQITQSHSDISIHSEFHTQEKSIFIPQTFNSTVFLILAPSFSSTSSLLSSLNILLFTPECYSFFNLFYSVSFLFSKSGTVNFLILNSHSLLVFY
uniref:Uncharacterized protein n=1 Tax=Cacopsylla melanoneura TaxID=428564 RepID=A0A8D8RBF0_9HEMI